MAEEPPEALLKLRALLAPEASGEAGPEAAEPEEVVPDWTRPIFVAPPPIYIKLEFTTAGLAKSMSKKWFKRTGESWARARCPFWLPVPLSTPMRKVLSQAGFDPLFPLLGRGCDVCVSAPTGQGKTLAYAVPILEALLHRLAPRVRAVVLLPTRDLAMQVCRVFDTLMRGLRRGRHNVAPIRLQTIGMKAMAQEQQLLSAGPTPDVVVCTPGRLAEHFFGRGAHLDLSALRWFVADEADRLLSQSYHRWLEVLFSATMTWDPRKLAALKLLRPLYFFSSRSGQHTTPAQLRQHWLRCAAAAKPLAVLHLLQQLLTRDGDDSSNAKVIVFCQSVNTAHRLTRLLQILWSLRGAYAARYSVLSAPERTPQLSSVNKFSAASADRMSEPGRLSEGLEARPALMIQNLFLSALAAGDARHQETVALVVMRNGAACQFCHLPHDGYAKPDKNQRGFLRKLDNQELLAYFLPKIRCKAEMLGIVSQASALVRLLEAQLDEDFGLSGLRSLNRTMGGGFTETFAFGGAAPKEQSGGEKCVLKEPSSPFALPYAVGISSWAAGGALNQVRILGNVLNIRRDYWPVTSGGDEKVPLTTSAGAEDGKLLMAWIVDGSRQKCDVVSSDMVKEEEPTLANETGDRQRLGNKSFRRSSNTWILYGVWTQCGERPPSEELAEEEQKTDDEVIPVAGPKGVSPPTQVAEFSSTLTPRERKVLLQRFRLGKVLVGSALVPSVFTND
ncbi:ATP-dependent RNA helicase DDX51 [Symbiodinium microadriaticum]|uniref:ATP-dependent RNA helicase n=1 Tax=Symbiodinium microadriaticum TaxID=2951 RepID=A0A1Q9E6Q5_SYMMI|nr:ATP-dependent RNA helicase DDX51 [Symbiodinium microadriaticum]